MDVLQELLEQLRPVVSSESLDPILVPIIGSLGKVSSRDIYSDKNRVWIGTDREILILKGRDQTTWKIIEEVERLEDGTATIVTDHPPGRVKGDYYIELSDCPELRNADEVNKKGYQVFIHPITRVNEGSKILAKGETITLEKLIHLSIAGIESIWVYEAPRVYLVYETEIDEEVPVIGALVNSILERFGAKLVETIIVRPKFSMVKAAVASTFPDTDLILIGGASKEHIQKYNSSIASPVDLKFIGRNLNLSLIDGVPALWLSNSISKCVTICQLVISSIIAQIKGVPQNYTFETHESDFKVSKPHGGTVVPVQILENKIHISENFSRIYGYVIVPPDMEINKGDMINVYRFIEP